MTRFAIYCCELNDYDSVNPVLCKYSYPISLFLEFPCGTMCLFSPICRCTFASNTQNQQNWDWNFFSLGKPWMHTQKETCYYQRRKSHTQVSPTGDEVGLILRFVGKDSNEQNAGLGRGRCAPSDLPGIQTRSGEGYLRN